MLAISGAGATTFAGTAGHWNPVVRKFDPHCPMFIEEGCDVVDMHGGLGHRFLAFSHLISIASGLRLTLRLRFGSAGHYQQKANRHSMVQEMHVSRSYFFGDVLFAPLPDSPVRYVSVDSPKALAAAVAGARREHCSNINARQDGSGARETQIMASAPMAVVFNLSVCSIAFGSSSHHLDVPSFRKAFQENAAQRTRAAQHHLGVQISVRQLTNTSDCAALSSGTERPRIAVHIRRGDVLDCGLAGNFSRVPDRGLANAAYVDLLQQLTGRLQHSAIVQLAAEGASDARSVPDIDSSVTNFQQLLPSATVTVASGHGEHAELLAFHTLCFSDVLITGKSGFSFMAAMLCKKPVILAMPFWIPYKVVPNARTLSTHGSKSYMVRCPLLPRGEGYTTVVKLSDRFALHRDHSSMLRKACLLVNDTGDGAGATTSGRRLAVTNVAGISGSYTPGS